jgi:2-keto-3-deoxy-L-rhamnonate aldolase RhmA
MTDTLKRKLASGRPLGALWLSLGSPAIAEFAAAAAPDVIVIDRQHGLWDRAALEAGVAAAARGAPVMARLADHQPVSISEALDAGAEAVLAPLVETAEQAGAIVSAARFPPVGTRSGGGVRPGRNFAAYVERARRDTVVGVMIETRLGLENAERIASVEGVDFVFIGTGDLALSLGEFPDVGEGHAKACAAILEACRRAEKPCGAYAFSPTHAKALLAQGFRLVTVGGDLDLMRDGLAAAARLVGPET